MTLQGSALTNIGQKRAKNQDNCLALPQQGLFIVADGMGGHNGGETASSLAVETIGQYVERIQKSSLSWQPAPTLQEAIAQANQVIFERSVEDPSLRGMGTTTTALLFKDDQVIIGHVGDSRCYLIDTQSSQLWQLTRDHSLVQERVRAGILTRAEAETHEMRNVITRSVGFEPQVPIDLYVKKIYPNDLFLICSDGLSSLVHDGEILKIIQETLAKEKTLQKATENLIKRANENGGDDNITAVLIQVH